MCTKYKNQNKIGGISPIFMNKIGINKLENITYMSRGI